jgi:sugar-phosphatase
VRLACRAVLFDLDGVLVDSRECVERHWLIWAQRHDLELPVVLGQAHGRRTIDTIRAVAPMLDAEREARAFEAAEAGDVDGIVVLPGARELLSVLPGSSWAVVTSGTRSLALARLRYATLPVPSCLVTADDVEHGKPEPECYRRASELLGVAADDCVVIEDAPAGIAAARAASMRVIAVTTTHPDDELTAADVLVGSLREIAVRSAAPTDAYGAIELELGA